MSAIFLIRILVPLPCCTVTAAHGKWTEINKIHFDTWNNNLYICCDISTVKVWKKESVVRCRERNKTIHQSPLPVHPSIYFDTVLTPANVTANKRTKDKHGNSAQLTHTHTHAALKHLYFVQHTSYSYSVRNFYVSCRASSLHASLGKCCHFKWILDELRVCVFFCHWRKLFLYCIFHHYYRCAIWPQMYSIWQTPFASRMFAHNSQYMQEHGTIPHPIYIA